MCGIELNERKKSEELGELLGLEPVSLMIRKIWLRWFGGVKRYHLLPFDGENKDVYKACIL